MSNYQILWTETAYNDLESIIDYISIENPDNAIAIFNKIKDKSLQLVKYPLRGRIVPELNNQNVSIYREIIIDPWRLIYRIENKIVYIIALIDEKKKPRRYFVAKNAKIIKVPFSLH